MNIIYVGPALPKYTDVIESLLPEGFQLQIVHHESPQLLRCMSEADFLITFVWITRDMIQAAPKLKLIQTITAGYDKIDVDAAARAGIPVATTTGANAVSVAEHIFAMILALSHQIVYAHNALREGTWPQLELYKGKCFELSGKTIGLIGFGHIGQAAARIARVFGMEVLYYRRNKLPHEEESSLEVSYAPLESLLRRADIVSIQVPRTPQTRDLIGSKELGLMKKSALLINTARGGIVDEEALIRALGAQSIAGAALDVLEKEPPDPHNPLFSMDNVVLTPHTAFYSIQAYEEVKRRATQAVLDVLDGKRPRDVVNPEVLK